MNLLEFIASPETNAWIEEPGLEYYVKKWRAIEGVIILSNVYSLEYKYSDDFNKTPGAYWRFICRYSRTIPFTVEQVINPRLAQFFERLGWPGYTIGSIPQYCSPLCLSMHIDSQYMNPFNHYEPHERPSLDPIYQETYNVSEILGS